MVEVGANNALDRNSPTTSEFCDTSITNNHGGTNSSLNRHYHLAINIKVTMVEQPIKLNPLYTLLHSSNNLYLLLHYLKKKIHLDNDQSLRLCKD